MALILKAVREHLQTRRVVYGFSKAPDRKLLLFFTLFIAYRKII